MEVHDLVEFIRDFERRSYDVASRAGGRIVKIIGDEVMLSALDPEVACEIALQLIDEFRPAGAAPRGGIATGEVIGRLGDFFGPVVNLASRLVDHAVPGEVLADAALSAELGARFSCEAAGRRMLKGFAEPVAVVAVRRS
jgi:adenylate cyclase